MNNGNGIDDEFDQGAGETAVSYTYDFLLAAKSMIDHTFGDGFADKNPALVGACVQASAANLNAFMQATANTHKLPSEADMEAMETLLSQMDDLAAHQKSKPATKKKTSRKSKKA